MTEDARVFHEQLYAAYTFSRTMTILVLEDRVFLACDRQLTSGTAKGLQDSRHRFWHSRGFRLRSKHAADGRGFYMWLEEGLARMPQPSQTAARPSLEANP
jgi:hypothetical protein